MLVVQAGGRRQAELLDRGFMERRDGRVSIARTWRAVHQSSDFADPLEVSVAEAFGTAVPRPVLVVFDPRSLWLTAVETARTLALLSGELFCPPVHVVGVGVTADAEYMAKRFRDFTPAEDDAYTEPTGEKPATYGSGRADDFLDVVLDELLPRVLGEIGNHDGRVTIAGWSLSGLCALHAWCSRPRQVEHAIAVSPSLWWADHEFMRRPIPETSASRRVFLGVGELEADDAQGRWPPRLPNARPERMVSNVNAWADQASEAGIDVVRRELRGVQHVNSGHIGIAHGIQAVYGVA